MLLLAQTVRRDAPRLPSEGGHKRSEVSVCLSIRHQVIQLGTGRLDRHGFVCSMLVLMEAKKLKHETRE